MQKCIPQSPYPLKQIVEEATASTLKAIPAMPEAVTNQPFTAKQQTEHMMQRICAIQDIQKHGIMNTRQTFSITPNAARYLQEHGYNLETFKSCYGNQLQRILHGELISAMNIHAQQHYAKEIPKELAATYELAGSLNGVGVQLNKQGRVDIAANVVDFHSTLLQLREFGWAALEGVKDGVMNTAHTIAHPIEFAQGIGRAAGYLAKTIYLCVQIEGPILHGPPISPFVPLIVPPDRTSELLEHIKPLRDFLREKYATMRGPDYVRSGVSLTVENILCGKILNAAGNFQEKRCKRPNR